MSERVVSDAMGTPGWFGKLPALGDFVTRRLPKSFVTRWDDWLTRGVADLQRSEGEAARDQLLTFPIWRFLAPPGAIDANGWLGLLAPSVDRVGRCFPLTVATALDPQGYADCDLRGIARALDTWAYAVTGVLDDDNVDAFDATLAGTAIACVPAEQPAWNPADPLEHGKEVMHLGMYRNSYAEFLRFVGAAQIKIWSADKWVWWAPATDSAPGEVLLSRSLDAASLFRTLVAPPGNASALAYLHG